MCTKYPTFEFGVNYEGSETVCGATGSTTVVSNTDELSSIQNCTIILGSVFVQMPGEALVLPPSLHTVTGGFICNASGLTSSPVSIKAAGLNAVLSSPNETSSLSNLGMVITHYPVLTSIEFPNLTTIGSNFVLTENPKLQIINGINAVAEISGNLKIIGNFSTLQLPKLATIGGDVDIESSAADFVCPIPALKGEVSAQGHSFVCTGQGKQATNQTNSSSIATSSSPSLMSSSPSSSSSSSASPSGCSMSYEIGICFMTNADIRSSTVSRDSIGMVNKLLRNGLKRCDRLCQEFFCVL